MWELNLSNYTHPLLGTVPKSWKWSRINEICTLSSGGTPSRKEKDNFKGNILWVTSGELKNRTIEDTLEKISDGAVEEFNLTLYDPGTVIIAIYGLEAEGVRGTASILKKKSTISQACMAFANFQGLSNVYFYYWYLNYGTIIGKRYAQGTKQQNLSQDIVAMIPICYPSLSEQRKIVTILSTQDKVIELKEKLFALKQQQKKYLMQQLLMPKNKEKSFKAIHLSDISCLINKHIDGQKYNYVSTENISPNLSGKVLFDESNIEISGVGFNAGDILVGNIRPYLKKVWRANKDGLCSTDVLVFRPIGISSEFLYYLIANDNFFFNVMTTAKGSKMPRGDKKAIMNAKMLIPESRIEQNFIVEILSTADHEIDLLQESIEVEKQKKKALMQLLLTGKVRVK